MNCELIEALIIIYIKQNIKKRGEKKMLKWLSKKRNQKGFTLIELVVVIAILGTLMAIAIPRLGGFQENAKIKADEASAATIARAVEMYNSTNHPTKLAPGLLNGNAQVAALKEMVDTTTKFTSKKYGGATTPAVPYIDYDSTDVVIKTRNGGAKVYPK